MAIILGTVNAGIAVPTNFILANAGNYHINSLFFNFFAVTVVAGPGNFNVFLDNTALARQMGFTLQFAAGGQPNILYSLEMGILWPRGQQFVVETTFNPAVITSAVFQLTLFGDILS